MSDRSNPALKHLLASIESFRHKAIELDELQRVLWSTAEGLTSREERDLRQALQDAENRLELIRFTVSREEVTDQVLQVLGAIQGQVKEALARAGQ